MKGKGQGARNPNILQVLEETTETEMKDGMNTIIMGQVMNMEEEEGLGKRIKKEAFAKKKKKRRERKMKTNESDHEDRGSCDKIYRER